jgi:hypothetical protein
MMKEKRGRLLKVAAVIAALTCGQLLTAYGSLLTGAPAPLPFN